MRRQRPPTILIAGAGVVGLAVAALLATGRCAERLRVQVIEPRALRRWRADETDLRVYALSRASQRLLENVGAWRAISAARVSPYRRMHVWEGDDPHGFGSLEFDAAELGEPDLGHIVEDSLLRTVLTDLVSSAANAELTIGEIESLDVGRRTVTAALANGGAAQGSLLIAADGSDSKVRTTLDLPVHARSYEQIAIVTHVTSTRSHAETAWQRFLPGGPLAFLPLADLRSSIVWSLPEAEAKQLASAPEAEFLRALQEASADVLGELTAIAARATFPLQVLHAERYCSPRVALAGDAAHTVHPLAGQGMNLGLLDAAAIASVVEEAVLAGEDPGDLKVLRRYERERKGDNRSMSLAFDALHRLFRLPGWAAPFRATGLRAVNATGPAKRLLMERALGLNVGSKNPLRWSLGK